MKTLNSNELFSNRKIVIATKHEKELVIAPLLERELGVRAVIPKNFDSDQFGTFTREIKRAGNQLEAARKKAEAAMAIAGVDLAVSSEGSFGAHPSVPFVQSNFELVLFVDKKHGYEIRGHHRTPETNMDGQYVTSTEEALDFAKKIGFPGHGIIVRQSENGKFGIHKNVRTEEELEKLARKMLSGFFRKRIFLETDMRAHRNPTRMQAIAKATEDLIKNIRSQCPGCFAPGFVVVDFEKGLPCRFCGIPTDLPVFDVYRCARCGFSEKKKVTQYGKSADQKYCGWCNP